MPSDTTPTRTPVPSSAELRAHGVGVQDGVAFGVDLAGAAPRVGRQPDRVDDGELRDRGEARHRQVRLHAAPRGVADLDRDAGVGQLRATVSSVTAHIRM